MLREPERADQPGIPRNIASNIRGALVRIIFVPRQAAGFRLDPQFVATRTHCSLHHRALTGEDAEVARGEGGGIDGAIELQLPLASAAPAYDASAISDPQI